jgi:DNA-binding NtrC family response regulator
MDPVLKLLIVDDESRFLKTISQRLKLRGFAVATATNGQDAIALARQQPFEVALLDLKMPGMDGKQVHTALKEIDPQIETIILTGHGSLRSAMELSEMGAYSYLPKPYELEKLIATLAGAFAERQRKKYADRPEQLQRVQALARGDDPLEVLRLLRKLDSEPP